MAAAAVTGPVHKVPHCSTLRAELIGGRNDGRSAMTQQAARAGLGMKMGAGVSGFNLCLRSPGLGGMPGVLNTVQLMQLNAG